MNRKLIPYVNFLLDNNPSPFCDYIICKELLKEDEKTIRDAYEWAKRFKLYTEIQDEQFPDGSWGGYIDALSSTQAQNRKYKATARAIGRILDLSLDEYDPMTVKTIDYCQKVVSGEIDTICMKEKKALKELNLGQCAVILSCVYCDLARFTPENKYVVQMRNEAASHFKKCCINGIFETEKWERLPVNNSRIYGIYGFYNYRALTHMLSYGDVITEKEQRILLNREWKNGQFGCDLTEPVSPDVGGEFVTWMISIEHLKEFSLFPEYMAEKITPYFYSLCERLIDPGDKITIAVNRYYGKTGQYSETWNRNELKKKDLLLRIIRILNLCD